LACAAGVAPPKPSRSAWSRGAVLAASERKRSRRGVTCSSLSACSGVRLGVGVGVRVGVRVGIRVGVRVRARVRVIAPRLQREGELRARVGSHRGGEARPRVEVGAEQLRGEG
jgi:hypothetical protein